MKTIAEKIHRVLIVSGLLALLLGLIIWSSNSTGLIPVHELLGWMLLLSLWISAVIGARSGVSVGIVGLASIWWFVTLLLAVAQKVAVAQRDLVPGNWHWTIRVLHVLSGLGAIALGQQLAIRMRQNGEGSTPQVTINEAATEFLAKKRIAVTGVSRKPETHGSNIVYQRLRQQNYEVFAVNPNADQIEGDQCFHDLTSIPGGVDAVLIGTRPEHAMTTMRECAELGVKYVWMHRSVGTGSVSVAAAAWGRAQGIRIIDGGCPLMFEPTADPGHKLMRSLFTLSGKVPRRVS